MGKLQLSEKERERLSMVKAITAGRIAIRKWLRL
jgi:hypothetical protein